MNYAMNEEQQEAARLNVSKSSYPRFKPIFTWSRQERRLRLFRLLWFKGLGPGFFGDGNYAAKLSVSIDFRLMDMWIGAFWRGYVGDHTTWLCVVPCMPLRIHYQRSYGGWFA